MHSIQKISQVRENTKMNYKKKEISLRIKLTK